MSSAENVAGGRQARAAYAGRSPLEATDGERSLIAAIAEGDQRAFGELHMRYYRRIASLAWSVTYRPDLVHEIANDTLWVVWRGAAGFRSESKVSTWIMGIARNLSFKALRGTGCEDSNPRQHSEPGYEPSVQAELTEWICEALARLPAEQRMVLEMFYGLDHSCEEISHALSCPVSTVKTRMFHGRRKLREILPQLAGATHYT
jgi:RNA polymerase sigma-70 factor (ECF subfamily)